MKLFFLPLLFLPCFSIADTNTLSASKAAKTIVENLKTHATKMGDSYYIYNKPILLDFNAWEVMLENTFENCDKYSLYISNSKAQKDCYIYIGDGYNKWLHVAKDQNISTQTWLASLSAGTRGNIVDFHHWVAMTRVYSQQFNKINQEKESSRERDEELRPYEAEKRATNQEIMNEIAKPFFQNKAKLKKLGERNNELNKIINDIYEKYSKAP